MPSSRPVSARQAQGHDIPEKIVARCLCLGPTVSALVARRLPSRLPHCGSASVQRRAKRTLPSHLSHLTRVCLLRALLLRHMQRLSAAAHHQRGQFAGSHLLSRGANACASSRITLPRAAPDGLASVRLC